MKKNKIFIDNFYEQNLTLGLNGGKSSSSYNVITGFHSRKDNAVVKKNIISEIFKALLLHDKIVFPTTKVLSLIESFGIKDTISLLNTGRFELIDDHGSTVILEEKSKNNYSLSGFQTSHETAHETGQTKNSIDLIELRLNGAGLKHSELTDRLLLNVEKHTVVIDTNEIVNNIKNETQYDILNNNIASHLNLSSSSINGINRCDIYNILRLSKLNKSLIYASMLNIDNIALDGEVKSILTVKLSKLLNYLPSVNLFDELFLSLFDKKCIPDLAGLYVNGIITIDEYLGILATSCGKRFRDWILDKDYNQIELEADIINSNPAISNKYSKLIRWTIPNAVSLIIPSLGISSSFADSFLLEKLSNGWHPNLFLDNLLKKRIDEKIEWHARSMRIASIKEKFPNIGRNSICPCGSKKKFKKCCGK